MVSALGVVCFGHDRLEVCRAIAHCRSWIPDFRKTYSVCNGGCVCVYMKELIALA